MLFPPVEANYAYYVAKNLLQSGALAIVFISTVQGALDDDLVKVSKDFVLLEDHGSCPRTVVDGEVQHPFMGGGLPDVVQKLFQVLLVFKHIFVVVRHLGHRNNLAALLQEDRDADVLGKREQRVEVAQDLLVRPLLVKLFEVFPVALERSRLHFPWCNLSQIDR